MMSPSLTDVISLYSGYAGNKMKIRQIGTSLKLFFFMVVIKNVLFINDINAP